MCPSNDPVAHKLRQPLLIEANLNGERLRFQTSYGVFSPREIDEGTQLLVNHLEVNPGDDCFDLGCGYGPIGLYLAKKSGGGQVILADKDFVAVEHAKHNIRLNGIQNAEARLSNGFSALNKEKFDLIVSNIPAKVGNEMLNLFLLDAKYHLKPGGRLVVVTVNGLRHFCKRTFTEIFGNYKKVKQGKTYTVSMTYKNEA